MTDSAKKHPKFIQIAAVPDTDQHAMFIFSLDEDGDVWCCSPIHADKDWCPISRNRKELAK